jgi:RNA polymerase sigma factor (sigma-70 family)
MLVVEKVSASRVCAEPSKRTWNARSDEQLVALVRDGHQHAFDALAARYQSGLLRFCQRMLRSAEDGEDALQEVFVAAFNAIVSDNREIRVRPWLYRIATNRCINHMRRAKAHAVEMLDDRCDPCERSVYEQLVSRQSFRALVGDVQALPERQRAALLMREIDGLSYERIATGLATTVPGVKSLLVRARVGLLDAAAARSSPSPPPGDRRRTARATPWRGTPLGARRGAVRGGTPQRSG